MAAINALALSKRYDSGVDAVRQVSFTVEAGHVYGFLGPNGAGKTTTVKLLTGMIQPTGGSGSVAGCELGDDVVALHRRCGVLTETAQCYEWMTGRENLLFFGELFGVKRRRDRCEQLLREMELLEAADRRVKTYSTGMKKKLSRARALLHEPDVLFLDEPTSGLDPEAAAFVNDLILAQAHSGRTVFLCTHQLHSAQAVCDHYGLMNQGRLLATGTLEELAQGAGLQPKLRIDGRLTDAAATFNGSYYELPIAGREEIPGILRRLVTGGADLYEVQLNQPTVEDVYFAWQRKGERV